MKRLTTMVTTALTLVAFSAFAQDAATQGAPAIQTNETEALGTYLQNAQGQALYAYVSTDAEPSTDAVSEGTREAAASCTGDCLNVWPPFTADGATARDGQDGQDGQDANVSAGEGVNADMIYTADVEGHSQVVYNGWPLYTFAQDQEEMDVEGHGIETPDGMWQLIGADGMPIPPNGESQPDPVGEESNGAADGADGADDGATDTEDAQADDGSASNDASEADGAN